MAEEAIDTSGCLVHLEEFLDTLVALPHDSQRLITQLREQDARACALQAELVKCVADAGLISIGKPHHSIPIFRNDVKHVPTVRNDFNNVCSIANVDLRSSTLWCPHYWNNHNFRVSLILQKLLKIPHPLINDH